MTPYVLSVLGYVLGWPFLLFMLSFAQKKLLIEKKQQKRGRSRATQTQPDVKPFWGKLKELVAFAMKDSRDMKKIPVKRKFVYWGLYGVGLMNAFAAPVSKYFLIMSIILWWTSMGFAIMSSRGLLSKREKVLKKMFEIGVKCFGYDKTASPETLIKVTNWRDMVYPDKVEYEIPTGFDESGQDNFQRLFNQFFGQYTAFVPDNQTVKDEFKPGWDYENNVVKLRAVPPLPKLAKWDEHYITSPGVSWSFFPVGLGVENGLELKNPKTGEIEHVIGYDIFGNAGKEAAKAGLTCSDQITASPSALVAGSTGGGKALAASTPVLVRVPK